MSKQQGLRKRIMASALSAAIIGSAAVTTGWSVSAVHEIHDEEVVWATGRVLGDDTHISGNLFLYANLDLNGHTLTIDGSLIHSTGTLDLHNGRLDVNGDYRLQQIQYDDSGNILTDEYGNVVYSNSDGILQMNDEDDYFVVGGNFYTQSRYGNGAYYNDLTNGTLELKGNFTQISGDANNFNASDEHKVLFSGSGVQTVYFASPDSSGFSILAGTENQNVVLSTARIRKIGGENITVSSFNQYGSLDVNGNSLTVTGDVTQNGNISVNSGTFTVGGNYLQPDGTLDLYNGRMEVQGDYRMQTKAIGADGETCYKTSNGILQMNDESDYFTVDGNFYTQSRYGNGAYYNDLVNGTLELKGNFTQISGDANNFNASGEHKVIFSGEGLQTIKFDSPNSSGFNYIEATPNTKVDLNNVRISKVGGDTVTVKNFVQYGNLDINGKKIVVTGSLTQNGNIYVNKGNLTIKQNLLQQSGDLDLNNGKVYITGNYRIQNKTRDANGVVTYGKSSGTLKMNDKSDYLKVSGKFITQSIYGNGAYYNDLTNGKMELKGDFAQLCGDANNFNASDNHKIVFSGTKTQTINFEAPESSGFNIVSTSSNPDVKLTSARIRQIGAENVTFRSFNQYGTLDINGNNLTVTENVIENGNVNVNAGSFTIGGDYLQPNGTFDLNDGSVRVQGNYRLQSAGLDGDGNLVYTTSNGILNMNNENDYFLVDGDFYTQSRYGNGAYYNDLVNGTLELKGNFTQIAGDANNFNASGNHKVIFSGDSLQTIYFEKPNSSGFNILEATPNTTVDLTAARISKVGGESVEIKSFSQYGGMDINGKTINVSENMIQHGDITVNGGNLTVGENYVQPSGCLDVDDGTVEVVGDYRIQGIGEDEEGNAIFTTSDGILKMNNENDKMIVDGNFYTQSRYGNGAYYNDLVNGTMELKGNFTQIAGDANNFNASGNHKVIFSGDSLQTIYFENPNSSGFNILEATPNTTVDLTAARISKIGGESVEVKSFSQYGSMDINGKTINVSENMIQHGDITVNGGNLTVGGDYVQPDGCLDIDDGTVEVVGDYRIQDIGEDEEGNAVFTQSDGILKMNNENDRLIVDGDFYTQSRYGNGSYYNDLVNGTMELKGNFTQIAGDANNFNASDNHKVIFSGDELQTVYFDRPNSSGFNILEATQNTTVDLVSARISKIGGNKVQVKNFVQYGDLDINGKEINVSENMTQNGNITVNKGKFTVGGDYVQQDGSLDIDDGKLNVVGDYRMQTVGEDVDGNVVYSNSNGVLKMNNKNDYFCVSGDFYAQSRYGNGSYYNDLVNGILELKGNFTQIAGDANNFNASDNHKVIFSGDSLQTIHFENPNNSGFNILEAAPNTIVDLTAARISKIGGTNVIVKNFTQYGNLDVNGKSLTVTEDMVQNGNISVNSGTLSVEGNYLQPDGTLDIDNGMVEVGGDYRLQAKAFDSDGIAYYTNSSGILKMNDGSDFFLSKGNFYTQSRYGDGSFYNDITNGILELKGDFHQLIGDSGNYCASFGNITILSGEELQSITFEGRRSGFGAVILKNPAFNEYYDSFDEVYYLPFGDVHPETVVNASRLSKSTINFGESTVINAQAYTCGGIGEGILYRIEIKEASSEDDWVLVQDYSLNQNYTFQPAKPVDYNILVIAKTGEYNLYRRTLTLTVTFPELVNTSTISAERINMGETVKVIASAEGGTGAYSYAVLYKKSSDERWATKQDYAPNNTVKIKLSKGVPYDVLVKVMDEFGHTAEKTFTVDVFDPSLKNTSTVSSDTINVGENVTVYASGADGAGSYTYAVLYKKSSDTKWATKQNYSDNATVDIKLGRAVPYDICVNVKDANGDIAEKRFTINVVVPALENTTKLSSENVSVGETITVNASATGGTEPFTYAVLYKKTTDTKWITKQNFNANTSVDINLTEEAEYDVCAKVKDANGTIEKKYFKVTATDPSLRNKSTVSAETVNAGDTVTVNASAKGGTSPYTYAVLYKNTTDTKWITLQNFTSNTSIDIKLDNAGTYDICVKVKDAAKTIEKLYFTVEAKNTELTNTSEVSSETISVGESVTVNASAAGGTAPYTYQVLYKKSSDTKWATKQDFADNSSVSITLGKAVPYEICVKVKDASGNIEKKYFTITVTEGALANTSTVSSESITVGQSVTVNASATGGTAPYTYAVYYKKTSDSKWATKQDFSENSSVSITLGKAVPYEICVKVKDASGTIEKKYFNITVS